MYVCLCSGITDKQIREAIKAGARSVEDLAEQLGVGLQCGSCVATAFSMIGGNSASHDNTLFHEIRVA